MSFDEALNYLLSLGHETLAIKLGLANITTLLEALGNPQNSYLKIQIAGTNGKGSTSAMLDSITHAAGIKTGLYTSPHLVSITERIKINGRDISEEEFSRLATKVKETAQRLVDEKRLETPPTFFEQVTAIALLAFKEFGVDVAILETGLGGRLDATTATRAEIAAITPIALDHQEILGDTLAKIAAEKAAIIHSNSKAVISAPQDEEAMNVILKRCGEFNMAPIIADIDYEIERTTEDGKLIVTFKQNPKSKIQNLKSVRLSLRGRHQITNASAAINAAETLNAFGYKISSRNIIEGLERAVHAGRLEMWDTQQHPAFLFDGAHNTAGAKALQNYLQEFVSKPVTLIFGAMREKDINEIASLLFPTAQTIILTKPDSPRAASLENLIDFDSKKIKITSNVNEALRLANEITPREGLICVTGSLYLIGEVQKIMRHTS